MGAQSVEGLALVSATEVVKSQNSLGAGGRNGAAL